MLLVFGDATIHADGRLCRLVGCRAFACRESQAALSPVVLVVAQCAAKGGGRGGPAVAAQGRPVKDPASWVDRGEGDTCGKGRGEDDREASHARGLHGE